MIYEQLLFKNLFINCQAQFYWLNAYLKNNRSYLFIIFYKSLLNA